MNTRASNITRQSRRVNRKKTLDGGVSINDMGFSHGDRTFEIVSDPATIAEYERARYMHQAYPSLLLSCDEGLFFGTLKSVLVDRGKLYLTFLTGSKENA